MKKALLVALTVLLVGLWATFAQAATPALSELDQHNFQELREAIGKTHRTYGEFARSVQFAKDWRIPQETDEYRFLLMKPSALKTQAGKNYEYPDFVRQFVFAEEKEVKAKENWLVIYLPKAISSKYYLENLFRPWLAFPEPGGGDKWTFLKGKDVEGKTKTLGISNAAYESIVIYGATSARDFLLGDVETTDRGFKTNFKSKNGWQAFDLASAPGVCSLQIIETEKNEQGEKVERIVDVPAGKRFIGPGKVELIIKLDFALPPTWK